MTTELTELEALFILSHVPELGPARIKRLIEYFGSAKNVFNASLEELETINSIGPFIAKNIFRLKNNFDVKKELEILKKNGVKIVTYNDEEYPHMLHLLPDAPKLIYVKGEIKQNDSMSISIVGTRRPTSYGRLVVENLVKELSKYGLTIVSGLANGIDTLAHEYAIRYGLRTIAVLGNGLGIYYPSINRRLQDKIPNYGAVISEFPFKYQPSKITFPQRNRIIAALSLGTVVVEADIRSGAIITSNFALELGKDVFAVPGSVFSAQSRGTNYLIKHGAKIVTSAEDIIDEIQQLARYVQEGQKKGTSQTKNNEVKELSEENKKILEIIKSEPEGIHIDKLQVLSGVEMTKLMNIIFILELDNRIKSLPGKIYLSIEK